MLVRHILPEALQRLVTVQASDDLTQIAMMLSLEHINAVLVCDDEGRMIGIITDSDIVRYVASCPTGELTCTLLAAATMTVDVVSCHPGERLSDLWPMMRDRHLRHIPVIDHDGKPLGVLYTRDVLKHLLDEVHDEEDVLKDYIMGVYR
jgi:CBS domain-containing protein